MAAFSPHFFFTLHVRRRVLGAPWYKSASSQFSYVCLSHIPLFLSSRPQLLYQISLISISTWFALVSASPLYLVLFGPSKGCYMLRSIYLWFQVVNSTSLPLAWLDLETCHSRCLPLSSSQSLLSYFMFLLHQGSQIELDLVSCHLPRKPRGHKQDFAQ